MKPPCEVVVKNVIPTVRSILAMDLSTRYGMSQAEIADKLNITQPAVSQYLNSGEKVRKVKNSLKDSGIYPRLEELSDDMAEGDLDTVEITRKYCDICQSMNLEEILSIVDPDGSENITPKDCEECLEIRNSE